MTPAKTLESARSTEDEFEHPYPAVDVVLFTVHDDGALAVMLINRSEPPLGWALPGAFVQMREDVDTTARRVLREKLGFATTPDFIALRPFGSVGRDPRRRVISLPHVALVDLDRLGRTAESRPGDVRAGLVQLDGDLQVTVEDEAQKLAFDHAEMLAEAVRELRRRVELDDPRVHAQLLPERFTLRKLQEVHEAILGVEVNRDSFRRRVLTSGRLVDTSEREAGVGHRPATLYRWRAGGSD